MSLQFDDLRVLNVSDNFSITTRGFKLMVDHNPGMVWFSASMCSQLEDTSVIYMLKHWKRLVRLEINKNICLSDSVDLANQVLESKYLTFMSAKKLEEADDVGTIAKVDRSLSKAIMQVSPFVLGKWKKEVQCL